MGSRSAWPTWPVLGQPGLEKETLPQTNKPSGTNHQTQLSEGQYGPEPLGWRLNGSPHLHLLLVRVDHPVQLLLPQLLYDLQRLHLVAVGGMAKIGVELLSICILQSNKAEISRDFDPTQA